MQPQRNNLDDAKRRIIGKVSLETLIGETVTLTRRGTRLTGLCPFHAEKSPSFYVFDDHFHCFGCHVHGDAITFVRKTREMSFIESLRFLANKYSIEAPELEENARYQQRRNEQAALSQIMVSAQDFFATQLQTERGEPARQYLRDRGFSDANIVAFGFGLTAEEHFGLVRHLRGLRFRDEDVMKVGLGAVSNKTGKMYDFFRERITIPIRDSSGRVIAFGGRTTVNDPAKYKNSMATPLFDKSNVLFGLDQAKDAIKDRRRAILVEGYMDALCLWQEGFPETVACMGTALTVRQLKQLVNHAKCSEVILLLDGDRAGQMATLEAIEASLEVPELRIRAARLTDGFDPDTFVRTNGSEALRGVLDRAADLIDTVISSRLADISPAAIPKLVAEEFVPWLSRVPDAIKRGFLMTNIANRTGVPMDVLTRQVQSLHFGRSQDQRDKPIPQRVTAAAQAEALPMIPTRPLTPVEEGFIGHLFHAKPGEIDLALASEFALREMQLEPLWEAFARAILGVLAEQHAPMDESATILAQFTVPEVRILNRVTESNVVPFECSDRGARLAKLVLEHKRQTLQKSISAVKQQVQIAGAKAPETVSEILQQIVLLNRTLTEIQTKLIQ